jgi:hypothetical protein
MIIIFLYLPPFIYHNPLSYLNCPKSLPLISLSLSHLLPTQEAFVVGLRETERGGGIDQYLRFSLTLTLRLSLSLSLSYLSLTHSLYLSLSLTLFLSLSSIFPSFQCISVPNNLGYIPLSLYTSISFYFNVLFNRSLPSLSLPPLSPFPPFSPPYFFPSSPSPLCFVVGWSICRE